MKPIATWNPARGVWETEQTSLLCGHSEPYSATWPASGTTRGGVAYAHPTSARHTNGSGSSSLLPTPTAADSDRSSATYVRGNPTLVGALLPTPTASDANGPGLHGTGAADLRTTVRMLPTPTARDGKGPNQRGDATCLHGALLSSGEPTNPQSAAGKPC
nr:hypothetical protein [Saccharothrix sp.]